MWGWLQIAAKKEEQWLSSLWLLQGNLSPKSGAVPNLSEPVAVPTEWARNSKVVSEARVRSVTFA